MKNTGLCAELSQIEFSYSDYIIGIGISDKGYCGSIEIESKEELKLLIDKFNELLILGEKDEISD